MNNSPKSVIVIGIIITLLIIGGIIFWYFGSNVPFIKQEEGAAVEIKDGLGAEALKKTNNPLSNELPETNPFKIKTNPFK